MVQYHQIRNRLESYPSTNQNDITDPGNFMPIYIIPCVMKIFQRAVNNQLSSYMRNQGLPCEEQSSLQPKHGKHTPHSQEWLYSM